VTTEAWERRRQAVALRIEETAMQLFAAYGVDRVSVQQIAEQAGISERTFYR
jgi:AcrR family transcriptional regulator